MIGNSDSENDVLENIKDKLHMILDRSFKEPYRRKIDTYSDRLNICCPLCGDSHSDMRKKRGNLYLDSLIYHCYNCGQNMGINYFLKQFGESLSDDDKITIHEIQQNSKKFEKRTSSSQSSMTFTLLEKLGIPKNILFKSKSLVSPYKNEFASSYLKSRKIDIRLWKYFAYNPSTQELYILNLTPNERIIGYQIRQLDPNSKKARYLTRSMSKIYTDTFNRDLNSIVEKILGQEKLGEKYIQEEDGIENIVANLDRMSGLFNIMNITLTKPLTIVEGPIDSLSIDNCIATQGITKLKDYFDDVENVRYLFDNDKIGKEMSIKKLKEHKQVFLWSQYLNSMGIKFKVKDVNDLQKLDLINKEKLDECFSNEELDIMMV